MPEVKIRSKTDGFLRCGVRHPATWVKHDDGAFTDEQVERLMAEPMLQVIVDRDSPAVETVLTDAADVVDASYVEVLRERTENLSRQIQQLSDRVIQVERERDEARGAADSLATEKIALEAEVQRLKPFETPLLGIADPPQRKNKRGVE